MQPRPRTFHSVYEMDPRASQQQQTITNHGELTTNGVCKKFIHGKCRLAENCQYSHDKSKIKPCDKYDLMGQCGYGEKCNFSHDRKICIEFTKNKCEKGEHCPYRHVFKSCPNFEMGFCSMGKLCKLKHIIRKLCWEYMYGYCEKGSRCPDHHPKIFVAEDFAATKEIFAKLGKPKLVVVTCNYCAQIGHKANKCPKKLDMEPNSVVKCGLCGVIHSLIDDCNTK